MMKKTAKRVLIDPGHGPGNANRGPNGYFEYRGMWKLSNFLKDILLSHGVIANLTRAEHEDPGLNARGRMARDYDLFISEHSNAFNGAVRGCECFYSLERPNDRAIAAKLSKAVSDLMNNPNRGPKTRESQTTAGKDFFTVIRAAAEAGCPHVFLAESGFHDSWLDEEFLLVDDNLRRIAEVQAAVILEILGVGMQMADDKNNDIHNDIQNYKQNDNHNHNAAQNDGHNNSQNEIPNDKIPIMGKSTITADQLTAFLLNTNPNPKLNCTPRELAGYFISEGEIEGVRGDIAFFQAIHETGYFRYGGQVLPEQNNFAGIGATNNSPVGAGAWFNTPQLGVRAQVHHLKTYACTKPLVNENISPRAHFVTRGIAPLWTDLNGRWAVPGTTYGQMISALYQSALDFVVDTLPSAPGGTNQTPEQPTTSDIPSSDILRALDILVKHNVINSPEYWANNYHKLQFLDQLIINMARKLDSLSQ